MSETTSSIQQFTYRPELIEAGTVYHYIKSNIDGSHPARIIISSSRKGLNMVNMVLTKEAKNHVQAYNQGYPNNSF